MCIFSCESDECITNEAEILTSMAPIQAPWSRKHLTFTDRSYSLTQTHICVCNIILLLQLIYQNETANDASIHIWPPYVHSSLCTNCVVEDLSGFMWVVESLLTPIPGPRCSINQGTFCFFLNYDPTYFLQIYYHLTPHINIKFLFFSLWCFNISLIIQIESVVPRHCRSFGYCFV